MAARTMANAIFLLVTASIFKITIGLVLPNEIINAKHQAVLKTTDKHGNKVQNGFEYGDRMPNRIMYNVEEMKDMETDKDAENDNKEGEIFEWNVINHDNLATTIPSTSLTAINVDIHENIYTIDSNADEEKDKSERHGSLTLDTNIEKKSSTANIKRDSATSAGSAKNNNYAYNMDINEKDKHAKENIFKLKTNLHTNSDLGSNSETKRTTGADFLNVYSYSINNSDNIKFSFVTARNFDDTSKSRLKRNSEYDDDLYIWDNCDGKEHLAYIDGVFKCVEVSLENRNFGTLNNCPTGKRRVFLQNSLILCLPRKKTECMS